MKTLPLASIGFVCCLFVLQGCSAHYSRQLSARNDSGTGPEQLRLQVEGSGLDAGDLVVIDRDMRKVVRGSLVLLNWRRLTEGAGAFGPASMLGRVIALPGEAVTLAGPVNSQTEAKNAWFSTFKRLGINGFNDQITLPKEEYLIETDNSILAANSKAIEAIITRRIDRR